MWMGFPTTFCTAVLGCVLASPGWVLGQVGTASPAKAGAEAGDPGHPEEAYLSPSRYLNQYFKFTFELPASPHLQPIPLPASRDGNIQVLELGSAPPTDAHLAITAIP